MSSVVEQHATQPLNPVLYHALKSRFRTVVIANEGSGMLVANYPDPANVGRYRAHMISAGEYYRINCPYCGDTRHRLWISHQWAQPDVQNRPQLWLAHCYNEQCLNSFERRKDLESKVFGLRTPRERSTPFEILQGDLTPDVITAVRMPGNCMRVDQLPANHPAVVYLRDKRYHNVQALGQHFGVAYCHQADPEYRIMQDRIVIPVWHDGMLVGWQGRYVGDIDWKAAGLPKYYTRPGMPRRLVLYGLEYAKQWPFVVIVEGPTSVWRINGPAVALLGKTLSNRQQMMIQEQWANKPVVLILDPDAREEMEGIIADMLRLGRVQLVPVNLPAGTDPDTFTHEAIVDIICGAARNYGVHLNSW